MNAIKYALIGLIGIIGVVVSIFGIRIPFTESFAKDHWRAGVAALLLIILFIPAAFGLFIFLFDANKFKSEIVHYVKEHTQRDLVLQGDIKVTFFPKLGLDSGNVSLSQRNSAKEFASISNARLYIAWLPLFHRQLVFDHVEIDGARANLIRFKDGTTNFDDLLIRDESLSPMTFDIDSVHISNSSLNWQDDVRWKRVALQNLQIETGRLADTVPSQLTASFNLNSEMLYSDTGIELKSRVFFDRKAGRYEFADMEGRLSGTVAGFSNLDLNFKGNVDSRLGQVSLLAENVVISGTGNYGQRNFEAKLEVPKLQFSKDVWSGSQAGVDVTLSQFDEKWTTVVKVPAVEFANRVLNAAEFNADFGFNGEGRSLQGKLSGPVSMDFTDMPKLQLSGMALDLSAKHPMLSGELSAKATGNLNADFSEQFINLDLKAKIDDSDVTGKLAFKDFSHHEYVFDINANKLDLDRYISADWIKRYREDAMQLDLGGFKNLTLNGHLYANEFKVAKLKATKLAADIRIGQSVFSIQPMTAKFYGGSLTGSLNVTAQGIPQIVVKQNLKGIQMDALLADTASAGKLSGKGDVVLDLGAEGGTVGALRNSLNGHASIALARGSLAGINLRNALLEGKDEIGFQTKAHANTGKFMEAKFSEKTGFTELKAVINFKDGISHGNSFEMKSPLFRVAGEGGLMLDTGNIDYQLAATVSSVLNRRSAGKLAELRGVTVPIHVSGIYATPGINLDFIAASGDAVTKLVAAKAAAEQEAAKVEEKQAGELAATAKSTKGKASTKKQAGNTSKK